MIWGELSLKILSAFCIAAYPISVIHTYGRLNYIFNYIEEEIDYSIWVANRNKALITAVFLNFVATIYLFLYLGKYYSKDRGLLNFTFYKRKKDLLFHQLVEEQPNSFWLGKYAINNELKKRWEKL